MLATNEATNFEKEEGAGQHPDDDKGNGRYVVNHGHSSIYLESSRGIRPGTIDSTPLGRH